MSITDFLCCPSCGEVFTIVRIGIVGVWGKKDSKRFICGACGKKFTAVGGMTINEAMGSLR